MSATIVIPTTMQRETVTAVVEAAVEAVSGFETGEVILVANGPAGGRRPLAYRSSQLQIVECPVQRMSAARNAGLARAQNDVILLTDDDCLVTPEWAQRLTRRLRDGEVSVATSLRTRRDGPVTSFLDYQRVFHPRPLDGSTAANPLASCMGVRRDLIDFAFDEDLDSGDELQFGARLRDAGISTAYDTEAPQPLHLVPERLESVTGRFHRYGISIARALILKDRPQFSIPSATALYSSLCGNRMTTPRRFEEIEDPNLRETFAALDLMAIGSLLAGFLDESGRLLGREIVRVDRESLSGGWVSIEGRLADFGWAGDWERLPLDFSRLLTLRETRAPALGEEIADNLRQNASLTREAGPDADLDRGSDEISRRSEQVWEQANEILTELREERLRPEEEAVATRLRQDGIAFRDGLQTMETIAFGAVRREPAQSPG